MVSNLGVGLFARKYKAITTSVYFHGQASLGYSSGTYTDRNTDGASSFKDGDKNTITNLGINLTLV